MSLKMDEKQHHDSGYFPGLSNATAWVILGIVVLGLAIAIGVVGYLMSQFGTSTAP